jgi:CrcB protein
MSNLIVLLYIFIGGGLGSLARFGVGQINFLQNKLPIGTLTANILACIILGLTLYLVKDKVDESIFIKYFLVVGFCGGFSTFSTFSLETVQLFKDGMLSYGIANIFLSITLAVCILWVLAK